MRSRRAVGQQRMGRQLIVRQSRRASATEGRDLDRRVHDLTAWGAECGIMIAFGASLASEAGNRCDAEIVADGRPWIESVRRAAVLMVRTS